MSRVQMFTARAAAAVTAGVGGSSLVLFGAFLWSGGFELFDMGMPLYGVLLWDAVLCLIFFVQHSVMIRRSFRRRASHVVPAHWYGVIYTLASGAALVLMTICWQASHVEVAAARGAGGVLIRCAFLLSMAGVVWGITALRHFDPFGTGALLAHVRGEQPHPARFTIAGPYRWLRHPVYSFGIVAIWAFPAITPERLLFDVLFTLWIIVGAALEERDLSAEFGEIYDHYRTAVPMLVPAPSRPRASRSRDEAASESGRSPIAH